MTYEDLPSPTELLQQLGDSVIASMDARSLSGFEASLEEMIAYHRLLIGAYATTDDAGQPASYATLDEGWRPQHRAWLSIYRAIINRAVSKLGEESEYFDTLAHTPGRLLGVEERPLPELASAILDLGPMTLYRLAEWFNRRAAASGVERRLDSSVLLLGSDRSLYEDALIRFVGAWESTARMVVPKTKGLDLEADWEACRAAWPPLLSFLEDTALAFIIAVWNSDEEGVRRFSDMLLRWSENLNLEGDRHAFHRGWLVNAELLQLDWTRALARLEPLTPAFRFEALTPSTVLVRVLENLHQQVVAMAAAIAFNWSTSNKGGAFAVKAAERLLSGASVDEREGQPVWPAVPPDFSGRLKLFLAIHLAGDQHESLYGAILDRIAMRLDQVSERKVISGRVYAPSTIHDRDSLSRVFGYMLIGSAQRGSAAAGTAWLEQLANDGTLPRGDDALYAVETWLERLVGLTQGLDEPAYLSIQALAPNVNAVSAADELATFATGAREVYRELRRQRIIDSPIDPNRLREFDQAVHDALLKGVPALAVLGTPVINMGDPTAEEKTFRFQNVSRSQLIEPSLEPRSSNFARAHAQSLPHAAGSHAWMSFLKLPSTEVRLRSSPASLTFWRAVQARARFIGPDAILLMSLPAYAAFEGRFVRDAGGGDDRLEVTRKHPPRPRTYRQTVGDIDLHALDFSGDAEAYLFGSGMLESICYRVHPNGLVATSAFEADAGDPTRGSLVVRYAPAFEWRDQPVIHLSFPDGSAG